VGGKEGAGPLGKHFDMVLEDDLAGEKTWELAEARIFQQTVERCLEKGGVEKCDVNYLLGGDLINQIMATHFAARALDIPLIGLYGACSTMAESLAVGAILLDSGAARRVVCAASSHFGSAERQYRMPLEMGVQRVPSAQWTVTGAGATLLCDALHAPRPTALITHATIGRVTDWSVKDAANMGAVMAPAAARTLHAHLLDTGRSPEDYDLIITGDLGRIGLELFRELMRERGVRLDEGRSIDCGVRIFSTEQDINAGGSGCGCSAAVINGEILDRFASGELRRVAFIATGALLNATSVLQGETIPGIAHLVALESSEA
jgi:stage V sporulation protein AD